MAGMVATLYDHLESYEEIVRRYGSLEDALKEEKYYGDRLEQELNICVKSGSSCVDMSSIFLIVCSPLFRRLVSAA